MDPRTKAQLDAASGVVKQVITLSTGVLTLSLTFAKTLAAGSSTADQNILQTSWVLFGIAVLAGVWFLTALAGVVYEASVDLTIKDGRLRWPWLIQMLAFLLGVGLFVWFGFITFGDIPPPSSSS